MSNPKTILEINKKLSQYTTEVLAGAVEASDRARDQLKNAKFIEADLFARIKARDVRRALEKEEREAAEAATASPENVGAAGTTAAQETAMKEEQAEKAPAEPVQKEKEKPVVMEAQPAAEPEIAEEPKQKPVISAKETKPSSNEGNVNIIGSERQQEAGRKPRSSDGERRPPRRENTSEASARGHENKSRKKQDSDRGYQGRQIYNKKDFASEDSGVKKPGKKPSEVKGRQTGQEPRKRREDESVNRRKKQGIKQVGVISDDEYRIRKQRKKDRPKEQKPIEVVKIERATIVGDTVTVKTFAEKTGKPVAEIIKKLMMLGMMCTINSEIDFDTAELIAAEFDITLEQKIEQTAEDVLIAEDKEEDDSQMVERPPIVTIMGHVDHGKTSLLDYIRKTKVTAGEAGGITQHIGAYTININEKSITFLDTPGHEAFTAMRARGAQVTDVAILVVAADDGVMPQTVEAINHAKSANVPIIIAINKIDKEAANPDKIKNELMEYELVPEEYGGDTVMVPVSAATGEGVDQLLEMVLLVSEVQELKANPNRLAKGTIVEARLDKGRGPVATVLVQTGTLRVHDTIVAGMAYGHVRAMLDDKGNAVKEAGPSMPVEVIGFSEVPEAGDIIYAVEQDKLSKQVVEERRDKMKAEQLKARSRVSLDDLFEQIAEGELKDLNLIVKADVQGSVEAVKQSLEKLSNDEVRVRVIHGGVGAIRETDINLASASGAIIIGFNVRPDAAVMAAAEREHVDVRLYRVIYNAIEDVENAMKGMLAPKFEEQVLGHAEVRQTFKVSAVGTIAGCYVQDGKMVRNAGVRLVRDGVVIYEGSMSTLKRFKDDAKEVVSGYECGITLENFNDIKEGDVIEAFKMVEIER